ncbi:hypothetical protein [Novosphingobium terrae]|uniref:hypothetical protein n=1 Tax=Novosphingobium terrae TaxID=2726189 RepID=UPI00197E70D6|nr:hypothetical protein [Novosphingobium terrae]
MLAIQQRRERSNRQINERLRTLIAAYKVLGGSFTGDLAVDPSHLRDLHRKSETPPTEPMAALDLSPEKAESSDRTRRIRDAVEGALSDIILLGTDEHVRLATKAACELVAGHPVHTQDLVIALRAFIRKALDLDPIPKDISIPMQGPARPAGKEKEKNSGGDSRQIGSAGAGMGIGGSGGAGDGASPHQPDDETSSTHHSAS